MPYNPPGSSSSSTQTAVMIPMSSPVPSSPSSSSIGRNHKRSFTDEHGLGAFAPISGLPKRRPTVLPASSSSSAGTKFAFPPAQSPASPSTKSPKFQLQADDDDSDDSEEEDDVRPSRNPTVVVPSISAGAASSALGRIVGTTVEATPPLSRRTTYDEDDAKYDNVNLKVPFPTSSPSATSASGIQRSVSSPHIASPTSETPPPSIYRSPHFSGPKDPNPRRSQPLKPALKSNHSSPHLPSLAHQRALTQSAPSTPNLPKTAWLSPPGSGASTPSQCPSIPSTPKSVHFASSLESVVTFVKTGRPRALSNPLEPDTETETEREGPSSWGGSYPFPVMPDQVATLNDKDMSLIPAEGSTGMNGLSKEGERRMVYVETLNLPMVKPPMLRGSILVRNLAFQKRVAVRFTLDDWQTTSEVTASYSASLPSLPPPFSTSVPPSSGHSRSATLSTTPGSAATPPTTPSATSDRWDRFTFTIKLEDMERSLAHKKIFLVVCYQLPSQWGWESGGEWWDNNDGKNYWASFKMVPPPNAKKEDSGARPKGLAARTAASLNAAIEDDKTPSPTKMAAVNAFNFPPLPPPGPIRSSASTTSGGLSSTLKAQIKPVPLSLSTGPKLRQGRMETFSSGGRASPPGSPTTYTPPIPGAVPSQPGRRVGGSLESLPSFFGFGAHGAANGHVSSSEDLTAYGRTKPVARVSTPPPAAAALKVQPLKITTTTTAPIAPPTPQEEKSSVASSPVVTTPTIIMTGKKRGLSLSNYCSPGSAASSPTLVKSPTSHTAPGNPISMQSLIPSPEKQHQRNASAGSPVTPLNDFKIVGGMPATMFNEPMQRDTLETRGHLNRVASWDERAHGGWIGVPDVRMSNGASSVTVTAAAPEELKKPVGLQKDSPPPTDSTTTSAGEHTQELSGDSTLSTPDLERSPEQEERMSVASTDDDDEAVVMTLDRRLNRSTSADGNRSDDSSATQTPGSASFIPFPSGSPEMSTINPPQLSHLGRRTSSATGVQMKLEMPSRPVFKERPSEKVEAVKEVPRVPSPPSQTVSGKLRAERQQHFQAAPPTSSSPDKTALGLNVTSPNGTVSGPPAEFLAKYCFFVSSPTTSPPTSSGVASPAAAYMSPSLGSSGVDTPRASSPGLGPGGAWWGGMGVGRPEEKEKGGMIVGST